MRVYKMDSGSTFIFLWQILNISTYKLIKEEPVIFT